jgi:hypothetical protein
MIDRSKGRTVEDRFWSKVDQNHGHWLWLGYITPNGYGYFTADPKKTPEPAHRVAWWLTRGPIEPGALIGNLCGTRSCVRPSHHAAITRREHRLRSVVR